MKKISIVGALAGILISLNANAEIMEISSSYGEDSITYDTETRLGWLDLKYTAGKSYNDVLSLLDTQYEGYSLATKDELYGIMNKVFPSLYTATNFYQGSLGAPIVDTTESALFRSLFGDGMGRTYGNTVHDDKIYVASSNTWNVGQVAYTNHYTENYSFDPNYRHGETGWYLVSKGALNISSETGEAKFVQTVPVAGTLGLILLGFAGLRRK